MKTKLIKIASMDNVAVAVQSLIKGDIINIGEDAFTLLSDIPVGHKVVLKDISKGETIIKCGYPIGKAKEEIKKGHIAHIFNIESLFSESAGYSYNNAWAEACANAFAKDKERWAGLIPAIQAYERKDGKIGIRNSIWILPIDERSNDEAKKLAAWGNEKLSLEDGVYSWEYPYKSNNPLNIISNLMRHPNAGGVVILGFDSKNDVIGELQAIIDREELSRVRICTSDNKEETEHCKAILKELSSEIKKDKRSVQPMSKLSIGIKCDGTESFAAITANYLVGNFCNEFTAMGGTAILVECPEIFGAEEIFINRAINEAIYKDTQNNIEAFRDSLVKEGLTVYEAPSFGEKASGISTLEEKAISCIQKSGKSPVEAVLNYGDYASKPGLNLLFGTSGSIESTTAETVAGAHIILFATEMESILESAVPTLKIASHLELDSNMVDFNAGRILTKGPEEVTSEFISLITAIANGEKHTKNEK